MTSDVCYRLDETALILAVRLTPKSSRDAVQGVSRLSDGRFVAVARVNALPAEGAANKALCVLLAKTFKVPKSAVTVVSGHTSRLKQVRVEGDPAVLSETIAAWPDIT
ncbi:MAG: DUF167 domain-containing protein [Bauldia sp.]|uniref:DUF167 family protein n=1 Tax=Bauldia sp. TaxID=2575872 RepID=UPI001DF30C81|nr:DUF167 family protein [Bauldia sp.]MCB1497003.1 DUF167 domain-containing protein [Bauldia sp.]